MYTQILYLNVDASRLFRSSALWVPVDQSMCNPWNLAFCAALKIGFTVTFTVAQILLIIFVVSTAIVVHFLHLHHSVLHSVGTSAGV